MSYLDGEIVKDFKKLNIKFNIAPQAEHDLIVKIINEAVPFSGSQIAWSSFNNNTYIGLSSSQAALATLEHKIKAATQCNITFIGDSTDRAYSIKVSNLLQSLQIFSRIPQHTYILQRQLNWIACISLEGDIDFAELPPESPLPLDIQYISSRQIQHTTLKARTMKLICAPLTGEAMSLLDLNACPDDQMVRLPLTPIEHQQLLKSGIFDAINDSLRKIIDDYEDEHVDKTEELIETLRILENNSPPENLELLEKPIHLTKLAIDRKTGVFFYF